MENGGISNSSLFFVSNTRTLKALNPRDGFQVKILISLARPVQLTLRNGSVGPHHTVLVPNMPQHDDDDDQPTSYIGRTVRKYFPGHGFFRGTVAEEEEEGLFRVIYEDKDEEDMLVEELEQVLIKDDGELSSRAVLTVSTNGATQQSSPSLLIRRLVDALSDEQVAGITRRRWPLFRVATVCSGTDAPIMALEMIQSALSQRDVDVLEIDHLFSCENVPFKRDFIMKTSNPPVVFKDVVELHTGQGECHDGVVRPVPRDITILVAGTGEYNSVALLNCV